MSYLGYENWDTWNTLLILENDQRTYNWLWAWNKNWKRKVKKGTFDQARAESVVKKYLVPTARGTQKSRFPGLVTDSDINPKLVSKKEVVEHIMEMDE